MITRTRHGWGLLLAGVLAAALVGCGGGSDETGEEDAGQSESESQGSAGAGAETLGTPEPAGIDSDLAGPLEINGYVARVVADEGQGAQRVEVRRRGRVVWSRQGYRFAFASGSESRGSFEQGADATGDGGPNLIIREWTGEGDCCYSFIVLGLGESLDEIATISVGRAGGAMRDLDGDGSPEFDGYDWTFAGWKTSQADSPGPRIVLSYRDGAYLLAPELMEEPPPDDAELEAMISRVLKSSSWDEGAPPAEYWGGALELIYTGNPELASSFLRWAWAPDVKGREAFIAEFRDRLGQSPYYPSLPARLPE